MSGAFSLGVGSLLSFILAGSHELFLVFFFFLSLFL